MGSGVRQHKGEWTAVHPVIMAIPSSLAEISGQEKAKGLSRFARKALKDSAERTGIAPGPLGKDERGAPRPKDGLFWSVSHTGGYVAAVIAPFAIGIDIEEIRDVSTLLKEQAASEAEWQLAEKYDNTLFFRYWTAKEALLKAEGDGLAGLTRCIVTEIVDDTRLRLNYHDTSWLVLQHRIAADKTTDSPGHIASVTSGPCSVIWDVIEKEGA